MNRSALGLLTVAVVVAGCKETTDPAGSFTVTGHIDNRTGTAIPANTRILGVWNVVSGSPDYSYVFGEGTINRTTGTFEIRFDQPPPSEALNSNALGVGLIIATTDQSVQAGDSITSSSPPTGVIGVTAQYAVIFVRNRATIPATHWANLFPDGYAVGVGVPAQPPATFDTFAPASRTGSVLIIDDLGNIEIVNWS
ncbi:MAG TPA: hypothetical protein VN513_17620 [Gemmatimonadales bacterium]|nr:hypothetical protein [Gemmatimonadales bacterium]